MSTEKIALITGGSRGLGKNMAIHLAKQGKNVVITYNSNKTEADKVVAEIEGLGKKAAALQLNTGEVKTFAAFAESLQKTLKEKFNTGKFDFLVNNAGIGIPTTLGQTTEENFDILTNIHFKGVYFLTQTLLPIQNDGGRIINLSSGLARFSMPGYSVYGSLKAGMEAMTRYMAQELGARRIGVNIIAPGAIETDFGGGYIRDNAEMNKMVASGTALGRVGLPDDIGGVVAFLCSEEGRWINGQRIEVAGGTHL
jgi:NAD(P)-dependent dehydrogenase (short-subunit alcohol dehydrogenase family)